MNVFIFPCISSFFLSGLLIILHTLFTQERNRIVCVELKSKVAVSNSSCTGLPVVNNINDSTSYRFVQFFLSSLIQICKICKIYKFLDCFSFFVLRKKIKIAYSVNENTEKKKNVTWNLFINTLLQSNRQILNAV